MSTGALIFMLTAWICVLSLTAWAFNRLMKIPPNVDEKLPPPGSIP